MVLISKRRHFRKPQKAADLVPNTTKTYVALFMVGFVIQLSYFNWDMRWRICDRHGVDHVNCSNLFSEEKVKDEGASSWCVNGTVLEHEEETYDRFNLDVNVDTNSDVLKQASIESQESKWRISKSADGEKESLDCEEIRELFEEESVTYLQTALFIYCLPVIVLVFPIAIILDKFPKGWIFVATILGLLTCLTSILQISFLNQLSPANLVKIVIPAGIVGNEILLKLLAFGELKRESEIMELFEKCALIQSAFVAGKFIGDLIMSFTSFSNYWALALGIVSFASGLSRLLIGYFRQVSEPPVKQVKPISTNLYLKLSLIFLIIGVYFFAEVGESHEELEYMEDEKAWVLVTFSMYGSITDGVATVTLICMTFIAKLIIEKSVIDEKLTKLLNPATIGLIGVLVDAVVKLFLSLVNNTGARVAASILTVFGELVIVSGMCLLIQYTPTEHKMKAVSVAVVAEAAGKVGAGLAFRLVHQASKQWFFGFAFLYQLILLTVPFLSFAYLHHLYSQNGNNEDAEQIEDHTDRSGRIRTLSDSPVFVEFDEAVSYGTGHERDLRSVL